MSQTAPDWLRRTQQRLRQLIVAPSGVRVALAGEGDAGGRSLGALVRDDARLAAVERLEIYANAYFYRLLDCLAAEFPALREALGEALFHDLITAYLLAHPPRHPSVRYAGDRLPEFLASSAAAEPFRRRAAWAADLARLEWALGEAFDAPDAPSTTREELAAVEPERWASLCFELQPGLRLLKLGWPVDALRRARDREQPVETAGLEPEAVEVLVWRSRERASQRRAEPLELAALERLRDGACFGELCDWLADELGDGGAPARAAALIARWQADDLLSRTLVRPDQP